MTYESIEEINALTVDDVIIELMSRLLDLSSIPIGENFYNLNPDESLSLYDRVNVHIRLVKPTEQELVDELVLYKIDLIEQFNSGEIKENRDNLLKQRLNNLPDIRRAMVLTGIDEPNLKVCERDIVKNNDVETLELLETFTVQIIAEQDAELAEQGSVDSIIQELQDIVIDDINNANTIENLRKVIRFLQL